MTNTQTVGTCSLCGGRVSVPGIHMSIILPVPTCDKCGAVSATHGPIVQMKRVKLGHILQTDQTAMRKLYRRTKKQLESGQFGIDGVIQRVWDQDKESRQGQKA